MQEIRCRHCDSKDVDSKEVEIRHINSINMKITHSETLTELECRACGWVNVMVPAQ